jgi:hypothetical protein
MSKSDTKTELEALLKATEKNRVELQKSWKKAEDLEAAIQSARHVSDESKAKRSERLKGR